MDAVIQRNLDILQEAEIQLGYREVTPPVVVIKALHDAIKSDSSLPIPVSIRLIKLNPRKRQVISELVMNKHHADLQNKAMLSKDTLRSLSIERGMWSVGKEKRLEALRHSTQSAMQEIGLADLSLDWVKPLQKGSETYLAALEASDKHPDEKQYLKDIFHRWVSYTEELKEVYTSEYSKGEPYVQDHDLTTLYDTSPSGEASDALAEIDEIQFKLQKYTKLYTDRQEMETLMVEEARMYTGSLESRMQEIEQMAQIYYGSVALNEQGQDLGPITPTFDRFWDMPQEFISWLLEEYYFFVNGISKAMREHLDSWSFTMAGRSKQLLAAYAASPEVPPSKTDFTAAEQTDLNSSESTAPTN